MAGEGAVGRIVSLVDFLFVIYCSVLLSGLPGKGGRGEKGLGWLASRVRGCGCFWFGVLRLDFSVLGLGSATEQETRREGLSICG